MSPLVEVLSQLIAKDDIDVIGACSVIYGGGMFISEDDTKVLVDLLSSKLGYDAIVCDLGYVGSHVAAAVIALDSFDRVFQYVDTLDEDSLSLHMFYEGVTEFLEARRYGDQKAERLMSFISKRFPNVSSKEQSHISSSIELAFSELGISALRLAQEVPSIIDKSQGSTRSELKLALSRVAQDWDMESIAKLQKFKQHNK